MNMYLIMFCQSSIKVEYRIVSSNSDAVTVAEEFKRKRRNVNIVGVYLLRQCKWIREELA